MLTLCGFAVSNYHNKVKLALLEKNEMPNVQAVNAACVANYPAFVAAYTR